MQPEFIGNLPYESNTIRVGEHLIHEIHGYNPAAVYVRRLSGKTEGLSVSEIIISVVGDGYAQEELDAENAEAARYPRAPRNTGAAAWSGSTPTAPTTT